MLFDNTMKWVDSFVPMDSEVVEGSGKKAESNGKDKPEGSKKRTRKELNKESVKRQKLKDDAEKAEFKLCLEIVPKDDEAIIRVDGSTKYYKIFSAMLDDFDRQDVLDLYRLVKERFETTSPEGYDRFLWGDLITLFKPSEEDEIWKTQQDYTLISWSTASTIVTTARRVSAVRLSDLGASINLMPYSLYAKLSIETLKPTKMSMRLADKSFQYPVGIAENMLVEVVIRVKQKQLNLGVGTERIIFNINYVMKHSYSNDDTFFSIDVIDEILEEDFDALLDEEKKNKLVSVLKKHKQAFAWKTTDIPGIYPSFGKHKIQLLDDKKPVVQKQKRVNPNMQEVVKKEIVKLLDTDIIYPIADSPWVSPIHCIPKKGGITVVTNENDELVSTRTVTRWRVCIDYRKLNESTTKDHFPLPFMDQMLERLAGNKYFCFLDGFSRYFQIPIDPNDQEKITFTCPFGTYAYRHVHLVLNWEKCHFMVKEGIVLGHKVSSAGLEVDKAKIDVISKLPPLPILKLLEKDTLFEFDDECQKAFELLKEKLTCAPVIVSPNWNLPFELMCDASDFAVGAVLEIKDRKGIENVAADHLSRIENDELSDDSEVDDNYPGEKLMEINTKDEPWFADFANYLVGDIILKGMAYQQKNKIFSDLKHYFWEEPYLFKICSDGMIRRCIFGPETQTILDQCHHGPTGGHYGPNITDKKVLDSGFYWPTIIKEAYTLVRLCEACQKTGNISKRDEMPLNNIQ
ncbi:reverse transcriptase domain-containing protein, partial [Tanacetum coccineum]